MSERLLARTAMVGGVVFAILSFADLNPGSADVWFRQASHQLGEQLGIVRSRPADRERPDGQSVQALDRAHQTLRPDGTRQSPVAWP
ncbi:hypothetical protein TSH100_00945 [Azospirillum sp. TSH100]|uniref:hypothetical protein n=1 Tax=Azospirillum sp. TSH100 TaxID=652764 RepID=UPI000D61B881|nr:hypothetical protein [Azospirillum sp. TSH100]PWC91474.1 hypothetical protein TSH100_00945 [Azospirillum sp. TSH100]QCG89090.1 hypothetical protein E6C72_14840 [Azospirillum sp. TSH100]